jgi:hypothetical protein
MEPEMAKIAKKTAEEISMHINSLLVWNRIVQETTDDAELRENMKRYDEAADRLIALGISVAKYYE